MHTGSIFAHVLGTLVAPAAGAKLIWHVQDIVSPRRGAGLALPFFAKLSAARADAVVCPSEAVASGLRRRMPSAARGKVQVVPNGIQTAEYVSKNGVREATRRSLGLAGDAFVVLHVGRLTHWKGQRTVLEALRLLVEEGDKGTHAVIVGDAAFDGPAYRRELEVLAATPELRGRVVFTGWRKDVAALLAACDVLVHSSLEPEPFGLAIVEAMAAGRPVVASREGGPAEIVRDGVDGLLVDASSSRSIAAALGALRDGATLREVMGRAGQTRAVSSFDAARFVASIDAIVEAVGRRP